MPKIPQTGGISRQEVEQIVHETDNKIKFLPIQGESAYNIVAGQIEPKMLNISHNISVNVPLTYSDFKYNIQLAQHQDETQKEIYSTFNLDFKNYSLEIFIKILNQLSNLENQLNNLENQLNNLENQLNNLKNRVNNLEPRVNNLENQLNNLKNRVTNLENRVTNLEQNPPFPL